MEERNTDNQISDSSLNQFWKDIKKWFIIILSWIIVLIVSLIFLDNKILIFSGWWLISAFWLIIKDKQITKWHSKNYDIFRKYERDGRS